MSALKKYVLGPLRDPNVWLNRLSGEVNANRARATVVDNKAKSYPFVKKVFGFCIGTGFCAEGWRRRFSRVGSAPVSLSRRPRT